MYSGPYRTSDYVYLVGQLHGPDPLSETHHVRLWKLMLQLNKVCIANNQRLTIICERFQNRPDENRPKIELISKEYEGVVEFFAKTHANVKLIKQNAAQAVGRSAFWGDSKKGNQRMATCGMFKHGMIHAMDATRHYLYYVTFTLKDHRYLLNLPKENVSA